MGFFDSAGSGGAAALTPYGAAASVFAETIATPNTSASGDITSGTKTFGTGRIGGLQIGGGIQPWLIAVGIAAVVAVFYLRRR